MTPPINPEIVAQALDRALTALEAIWNTLPMHSLPEVDRSHIH
jgi:hypothetical protein